MDLGRNRHNSHDVFHYGIQSCSDTEWWTEDRQNIIQCRRNSSFQKVRSYEDRIDFPEEEFDANRSILNHSGSHLYRDLLSDIGQISKKASFNESHMHSGFFQHGSEHSLAWGSSRDQMPPLFEEYIDLQDSMNRYNLSKNTSFKGEIYMSHPYETSRRNLIVNYLPDSWCEADLLPIFTKFGDVVSVIVIRNQSTQKSKGFGFVKFKTCTQAERAMEMLDGQIIGGKQLKVAFAKPRKSRAKANLFISRFPSTWTSAYLENVFSPFGPILECKVLRTAQGRSKRCGFVRYASEESACQAILHMNSLALPGNKCQRLRCKVADRERYKQ